MWYDFDQEREKQVKYQLVLLFDGEYALSTWDLTHVPRISSWEFTKKMWEPFIVMP